MQFSLKSAWLHKEDFIENNFWLELSSYFVQYVRNQDRLHACLIRAGSKLGHAEISFWV